MADDDPRLPQPPTSAAAGPLSYAIVQVAKAHKAAAATLLREIGLHPGQELLLMQLADRDRRTQGELVRALGLDASTVARMVARLEQQGVVARERSASDRRAVVVSLTAHGAALGDRVRDAWAELERLTTAPLTERERDELTRTLRRIAGELAG